VSRARTRARYYGYQGEHFTGREWLALVDRFGGACLACGTVPGPETPPEEGLTVDHITPLSLGGSNHIENIQPLCAACNNAKGATVQDYRERSPPAQGTFPGACTIDDQGGKMQDKSIREQDRKEVPRSEMFSRVIRAVDGARSEAITNGDVRFARHVEEELFPFLEKEKFNAEVNDAAKEELEAALGVKQIRELSDEEHAEGRRLVRSCDAFGLMRLALDGESILPGDDKQNALNELRVLEEDATNKLRRWQREHGISD
jgi:5-methylcytosine-specific restriction endonuclease McrA